MTYTFWSDGKERTPLLDTARPSARSAELVRRAGVVSQHIRVTPPPQRCCRCCLPVGRRHLQCLSIRRSAALSCLADDGWGNPGLQEGPLGRGFSGGRAVTGPIDAGCSPLTGSRQANRLDGVGRRASAIRQRRPSLPRRAPHVVGAGRSSHTWPLLARDLGSMWRARFKDGPSCCRLSYMAEDSPTDRGGPAWCLGRSRGWNRRWMAAIDWSTRPS